LEQRGITASGFNFHIRVGIGEIQCLRVINEKLKIPKSFPAADIGKLNITSHLTEVVSPRKFFHREAELEKFSEMANDLDGETCKVS